MWSRKIKHSGANRKGNPQPKAHPLFLNPEFLHPKMTLNHKTNQRADDKYTNKPGSAAHEGIISDLFPC
jgi:hypothetical protein